MYELPLEDQHQIRHDLSAKLRNGGLEAANQLVEDYAVEEQVLGTYHDAFIQMEKSKEAFLETCNVTDAKKLLDFFAGIVDEHEHAMGRHAYALTMLFDIKSL